MKFFTKYVGVWHGSGTSFGEFLTGKLHIYTKCQDGFLIIPEKPGIGIDWNEKVLEKYSVNLSL